MTRHDYAQKALAGDLRDIVHVLAEDDTEDDAELKRRTRLTSHTDWRVAVQALRCG